MRIDPGYARPPTMPAMPPGVRLDRSRRLTALRFGLLDAVPGVRHAVTTRLGGVSRGAYATANLGLSVGDDRDAVLANRSFAAALVSTSALQPVTLRQVHGTAATAVEEPGAPGVPVAEGDMLMTSRAGLPLMVQSADCAALILVDPVRRAVAVAHAGWRGTAAWAAREAVASMSRGFGTIPSELLVAIGPAIRACCYEVGEDVAAAVLATCPDAERDVVLRPADARPRIDLAAALAAQLLAAGIRRDLVAVSNLCTGCSPGLFYSHRREGEPTGRFGALVCLDGQQ